MIARSSAGRVEKKGCSAKKAFRSGESSLVVLLRVFAFAKRLDFGSQVDSCGTPRDATPAHSPLFRTDLPMMPVCASAIGDSASAWIGEQARRERA